MKTIQTLLILIMGLSATIISTSKTNAMTEQIAVVVNNDAISSSDVQDRIKLVMVSSGLESSAETIEKLSRQVISVLIEEQIKIQEAERLELEIPQTEIDVAFAEIAKQNKFSPDEFKNILKQSGINVGTMHRQIKSQISWSKVIQKEVRPRINIRETDTKAALEQLKSKIGKTEYLVAEIFLNVENAQEEQSVRELAQKLSKELQAGQTPFFKVARQFSQSAGAAKGGDIGWIQEGILAEEIDKTLTTMAKEKISAPIRTLSGYHIILLRDKRTISEDTLPSRDQITNNIGMTRLEKAQRRHLMDLKANAFIDSRV